ncbi:Putative transcriptional regulator, TetR-family [Corynebacterium glyciniphilum AJ 3170]|uniref:Putative transcriptional regulator, TetR-family n=1 Tax=Corynebacterium glyciniphilum AJ 3170 TaxID=1404245 RepID=X5DQF5_9CORY|nr:TetR family transcriptional regulator [Corynebacterium glyciniphilum]AHW62887.1 Putative transcriptional regulator, TetR-family [Corynebacterium glyciniphilum AJ 3170]
MRTMTRRDEVFDAVDRLIGREGIPAVSMRAVAAEAGVSLRLVQYYGTDKNTLLSASLQRLSDRSIRRWCEQRTTNTSLRSVIEGYFAATLPVDEETCAFHRISVSMELMAVTGTEPAASAYRQHLAATGTEFTEACLEAIPELGEETAGSIVDTAMALGHGLGSLLMAGRISEESARATVAAMVADLPG